ncbi:MULTISPECIES: hypothetical protein [unclassified Ensifer]|uniref:hypothetical protein n=1 Tax=unclassified Ensifer TaxID=2633371 RepID=UPI000813C44A|nr:MULTISPECIES: hypothetical protein [unclassified Ensifer]OCP02464.1 hypothetical protein BC362_18845 [Ensifer sp. LC14]OCP14232.1 hypothetical protein BC374_00440 [Ensifer sp. LC13]OCP14918.1 hypothetical protein BBX50_00790 [Ensifer sp. LC11]OCP34395.1 hypothetical protein BC364_00440 [Ensifer sp. LC499]
MTPRTLTRILAVLLVASAAPALCAQALAQNSIFDQFPIVVACEYKGTHHAFYLSKVTADGTATYMASDNFAGTITLTGEAKAVGAEEGGTCLGKTIEELRASGQARDIRAN